MITQRAGETCNHVHNNGIYEVMGRDSANYLTTGQKYSNKCKAPELITIHIYFIFYFQSCDFIRRTLI